jgi:hypothetical protein
MSTHSSWPYSFPSKCCKHCNVLHLKSPVAVSVNGAYVANKLSWYIEEGYGEFGCVFGQKWEIVGY